MKFSNWTDLTPELVPAMATHGLAGNVTTSPALSGWPQTIDDPNSERRDVALRAATPSVAAPNAEDTATPNDDLELVKRITLGSSAALAQFYQRYQGNVMAFARSLLGCEEDRHEIVNDVFLTVWTNAGTFAGRSSVRTWVLGITHHKVIDSLRKRQRNKRIIEDYQRVPESECIDDGPEQIIISSDNAKQVHVCLEQLSAAHREVLHLAFFEDLSCNEIANVLGCPVGTVKTRLMHARNKLKPLLDAQA